MRISEKFWLNFYLPLWLDLGWWLTQISALQMATGQPPHTDLHPLRVLFLVPKLDPPTLEGPFSTAFKDFVSCCLVKDPEQRPLASDLLNHDFVRRATAPPDLPKLVMKAPLFMHCAPYVDDNCFLGWILNSNVNLSTLPVHSH